jgi:hypothetical protein
VCLNLYLTPNSVEIPLSKRSLYTAYELIQAVPLYDPYDTQALLLASNPWIQDFLPNVIIRSDPPVQAGLQGRASHPYSKAGRVGSKGIVEYIELFCFSLQYLYMKNKITREYITRDVAFFHPSNPGSKILKKLQLG